MKSRDSSPAPDASDAAYDPRPIGIFDSGLGGLSVWREIVQQLPHESTVYLADQAHIPYGPRSLTEVRGYSIAVARQLLERDCKLVVVACNTASAAALVDLRAAFPEVPFVGMKPAVKPAAEITRTGVIGVMATPATFQGAFFAEVVENFARGVRVVEQVCPGLVEHIEAGTLESVAAEAQLRAYLQPILAAGADTLVLACTHYPFAQEAIRRLAPGLRIIDPAPAVARQSGRVLLHRGIGQDPEAQGQHGFLTSGPLVPFRRRVRALVGEHGPCSRISWSEGDVWVVT